LLAGENMDMTQEKRQNERPAALVDDPNLPVSVLFQRLGDQNALDQIQQKQFA